MAWTEKARAAALQARRAFARGSKKYAQASRVLKKLDIRSARRIEIVGKVNRENVRVQTFLKLATSRGKYAQLIQAGDARSGDRHLVRFRGVDYSGKRSYGNTLPIQQAIDLMKKRGR